jgi:hypothetical protein
MPTKKIKKSLHWSDADIALLKKLYPNTINKDIAKKLNKSVSSVEKKGSQLGLAKTREFRKEINKKNASSSNRCKIWTDEEIKYLRNNYKKLSGKEIANILSRSYASIIYKAQQIGLKKNKKRRKKK